MFSLSKILLPVDFSEHSIGAAHYVDALAERFGSEVVLLHVVPPPTYEFSGVEVSSVSVPEIYNARAATLQKRCEEFLRKEMPRLKARHVLLEGDPARRIVEYAHQERVSLIVMPTHGYGPFRRFILGSVTAKVLHDAECPVWTGVHLEEAPLPPPLQFGTVVAAIDLGDDSDKVLCWAAQFAARSGARLVIAHATPDIEGKAGEYADANWREYFAKRAKEVIAGLQQRLGTQAEVWVGSGYPPMLMQMAADKFEANLMVIGRGRATAGVLGRLRANAYTIIRQAPCPVVSV